MAPFYPSDMIRWKSIINIEVIGIPKGQPRPRAFSRIVKGRDGVSQAITRVYDPGTAEFWKGEISMAARPHIPKVRIAGPIRLDIDLIFPRPNRLMRLRDPEGEIPHCAKPDRDNADKAIMDCLTVLGFWEDDCQVCAGEIVKVYCAKRGRPGARITISVPTQINDERVGQVGKSDLFAEIA